MPVSNVAIVRCYKKLVRELKLQLKGLEKELEMKLSEWQPDLVEQVKSVTGIGKRATAELIVYTQGFKGMQNYRQLISYAGLSPREFSSGSSVRAKTKICKTGAKSCGTFYICVP